MDGKGRRLLECFKISHLPRLLDLQATVGVDQCIGNKIKNAKGGRKGKGKIKRGSCFR